MDAVLPDDLLRVAALSSRLVNLITRNLGPYLMELWRRELQARDVTEQRERNRMRTLFELNEKQFPDFYRFSKEQYLLLESALELPATLTLNNGCLISGREALLMTIRRLAHPVRMVTVGDEGFGYPESTCSRAIRKMIRWLDGKYAHLLRLTPERLSASKLNEYATAVRQAGCPRTNIVGFIDATMIRICRPTRDQDLFYNGHKRCHAVKFQAVTTPDGLIVDFFGAYPARRHDRIVYNESGLEERLGAILEYTLYGDAGYRGIHRIERPYINYQARGGLSDEEANFNSQMSKLRVSVEMMFGMMKRSWGYLDRRHRLYKDDLPAHVRVAAIFTNFLTCLQGGNQVSDMFELAPPSLEEYLRGNL